MHESMRTQLINTGRDHFQDAAPVPIDTDRICPQMLHSEHSTRRQPASLAHLSLRSDSITEFIKQPRGYPPLEICCSRANTLWNKPR